jgi:hypothetical protein
VTADAAPDAKGGGMEVINVDEEDEDEDEVVDDVDAGDDDGNDCGIGVPTPDRGPVGPGPPWPAPSGGCPPATRTTGGSAIPPDVGTSSSSIRDPRGGCRLDCQHRCC